MDLKDHERILGVKADNTAKAYPFIELAFERAPVEDAIGGVPISIRYDPASETAQAFAKSGNTIAALRAKEV